VGALEEGPRYRQSPDALLAPAGDGQAALMHMGKGLPYALNSTGAFVWAMLEHPCSLREVAAAMAEEFDVTPERAREDAAAFLQDLLDHDLIQAAE
jgi:hypothetical protein